jgi:hypothetical protein
MVTKNRHQADPRSNQTSHRSYDRQKELPSLFPLREDSVLDKIDSFYSEISPSIKGIPSPIPNITSNWQRNPILSRASFPIAAF